LTKLTRRHPLAIVLTVVRYATLVTRVLSVAVMLCIAGSSRALSEASHIGDLARPSGAVNSSGLSHAPAGVTKPELRHRADHDPACDAIVAAIVCADVTVEAAPDGDGDTLQACDISAEYGRAPPLDFPA
jgi:hypothetical protein